MNTSENPDLNKGKKQNSQLPKKNDDQQERKDLDFRLISEAGGELDICFNVPKSNLFYKLPCSITDTAKCRAADMYFHCYPGEEFQIWLSDYIVYKRLTIIGKANYPIYEWHSFIENCFKNNWDGIVLPEPRRYQSNLSSVPFINNKAVLEPGRYRTVDFHFTLAMLMRYAKHYPMLDKFVEQAIKGKPVSLTADLNILSDSLREGIRKIVTCDLPEPLIPEYYDHVVKGLFIEMLNSVSKCVESGGYKKKVIDATDYVRDYIVENLNKKDMRIKALAQVAQISETMLKNCFKYLFKMTIHEFIMTQRLERAIQLLRNPKMPINSIGNAIGLKEPKYFYDFWKRFYPGITPEEWRDRNVIK